MDYPSSTSPAPQNRTIRLLAPDVSSKIAAGEVVERPASVVKELVENSLDAGATEISVDIKGGGIELVRVADNGSGIISGQVELAFQRTATSKIASVSDLDHIGTLGFRGEALPSIAAVSSLTMITRTASEESGTRIEIADGNILSSHPEGAAIGTVVSVRQLFRNVPARRKFLKTNATETSRIQEVIIRYALANPLIRFRFIADGSQLIATAGSGSLADVIACVYGIETSSAMLELKSNPDIVPEPKGHPSRVSVAGMVGSPAITKATRSHISYFVNGRWIQSRMLGYSLEQAYQGFLMEKRYPVAVISIGVPLDEVDVNIHPTKAEVRFHHEGSVFAALQHTVRYTLTSYSPVPSARTGSQAKTVVTTHTQSNPFWPGWGAVPETAQSKITAAVKQAKPGQTGTQHPDVIEKVEIAPGRVLPALRVLGQILATYIAAEGPDGMYLIDQHTAHERVLFERIQAKLSSGSPEVQNILEPVLVELDHRQDELLRGHTPLISNLGFRIEEFGDRTYVLRGIPSSLAGGNPSKSLVDILDMMADGSSFERWEDRAAYSLACHSAVKAGQVLSPQEMTELVRSLENTRQPHSCPHGRPTMVHMSSGQLEREFGRK